MEELSQIHQTMYFRPHRTPRKDEQPECQIWRHTENRGELLSEDRAVSQKIRRGRLTTINGLGDIVKNNHFHLSASCGALNREIQKMGGRNRTRIYSRMHDFARRAALQRCSATAIVAIAL